MASAKPSELVLRDIAFSFGRGKILLAAIVNRLPDVIAAEGKPLRADEIAQLAKTNLDATSRLLRTLAAFDVLNETEDGRYSLTSLGQLLVADKEIGNLSPQAGLLWHLNEPACWNTWHELPATVKEGGTGWEKSPDGKQYKTIFDYYQAHPESQNAFDRAMSGSSAATIPGILQKYDGFGALDELMDVGGGHGTLVKEIIEQYPNIKAINFDATHVIEKAPKIAGVKHVGGSFFDAESLPKANNIIMKHILHDWDDESCKKILHSCHVALPDSGKLLVVEVVIPDKSTASNREEREFMNLLDIQMMMIAPGGRERSEAEWRKLLNPNGFEIKRIVETGVGPAVIEAIKIQK